MRSFAERSENGNCRDADEADDEKRAGLSVIAIRRLPERTDKRHPTANGKSEPIHLSAPRPTRHVCETVVVLDGVVVGALRSAEHALPCGTADKAEIERQPRSSKRHGEDFVASERAVEVGGDGFHLCGSDAETIVFANDALPIWAQRSIELDDGVLERDMLGQPVHLVEARPVHDDGLVIAWLVADEAVQALNAIIVIAAASLVRAHSVAP